MFFFKNKDAALYDFTVRSNIKGHVDRCLRCGLCIDKHNQAAVAAPQSLPRAPNEQEDHVEWLGLRFMRL